MILATAWAPFTAQGDVALDHDQGEHVTQPAPDEIAPAPPAVIHAGLGPAQPAPAVAPSEPAPPEDVAPPPQPMTEQRIHEVVDPYGEWVEVDGVGSCWRPYSTYVGVGFNPYCNGRWIYTDYGWSWSS